MLSDGLWSCLVEPGLAIWYLRFYDSIRFVCTFLFINVYFRIFNQFLIPNSTAFQTKTPRRKLILSDNTSILRGVCKLCVCSQLSRAASRSMNLYLLKTFLVSPRLWELQRSWSRQNLLNEWMNEVKCNMGWFKTGSFPPWQKWTKKTSGLTVAPLSSISGVSANLKMWRVSVWRWSLIDVCLKPHLPHPTA